MSDTVSCSICKYYVSGHNKVLCREILCGNYICKECIVTEETDICPSCADDERDQLFGPAVNSYTSWCNLCGNTLTHENMRYCRAAECDKKICTECFDRPSGRDLSKKLYCLAHAAEGKKEENPPPKPAVENGKYDGILTDIFKDVDKFAVDDKSQKSILPGSPIQDNLPVSKKEEIKEIKKIKEIKEIKEIKCGYCEAQLDPLKFKMGVCSESYCKTSLCDKCNEFVRYCRKHFIFDERELATADLTYKDTIKESKPTSYQTITPSTIEITTCSECRKTLHKDTGFKCNDKTCNKYICLVCKNDLYKEYKFDKATCDIHRDYSMMITAAESQNKIASLNGLALSGPIQQPALKYNREICSRCHLDFGFGTYNKCEHIDLISGIYCPNKICNPCIKVMKQIGTSPELLKFCELHKSKLMAATTAANTAANTAATNKNIPNSCSTCMRTGIFLEQGNKCRYKLCNKFICMSCRVFKTGNEYYCSNECEIKDQINKATSSDKYIPAAIDGVSDEEFKKRVLKHLQNLEKAADNIKEMLAELMNNQRRFEDY